MKKLISYTILASVTLLACKGDKSVQELAFAEPVHDSLYIELGGEKQYVEIISESTDNPVLLFVHGGPAWPQTPMLRYYNNEELSKTYTVVVWEQRGAGLSYKQNPQPANLSLQQIVADGHELTAILKKRFQKDRIYLAGYSWGSLVGAKLATDFPSDYHAYIGIAQIVNMERGMEISRKWLTEQAAKAGDSKSLATIDSLSNLSYYDDELDRFFNQYMELSKYHGATYDPASEKETEKAMMMYEDYKDYNWFEVWSKSSKVLQKDMFGADLMPLKKLDLPVYLLQGRQDWNIPSVLAAEWLELLDAPEKKIFWFEKSGHQPPEEEAPEFNKVMREIGETVTKAN